MKKRVIATLLVATMVLGLCGCGEKEPEVKLNVIAGTPTYEDDKQIEMGAYSGPRIGGYRYWNGHYGEYEGDPNGGWQGWITEAAFQDYLDCGFTYLMAQADGYYDFDTIHQRTATDFKDSDLYPYMELAEKMGIPVVVMANELTNMTSSADYRLSEDQKAFLAEMVADLSQYKMFKGFSFRDEPSINQIKTFGEVKKYLDSIKSDLFYYTSYLPIYVNDLTRLSTENTDDKEAAYMDYVNAISDAMDTFSYDSYPLWIDPVKGVTYIDDTWFQNLRLVAENAKEKGYEPGITMQTSAYGLPGMEESAAHKRAIKTKADMTFQIYTSLAYGFKSLSYWTYWQHRAPNDSEDFYSAMINYPTDGSQEPVKTDAYYAVKEANAEIKKFDHVYLNFDWEGTMALTKEGKPLSTALNMAGDYQSPRVGEVTATNDTIIGSFKDADGYDGYMIVNATDPGQNLTDTVTITFREATKALAYIHGEEQTIELKEGTYTFELEAGAGVFVIPVQ